MLAICTKGTSLGTNVTCRITPTIISRSTRESRSRITPTIRPKQRESGRFCRHVHLFHGFRSTTIPAVINNKNNLVSEIVVNTFWPCRSQKSQNQCVSINDPTNETSLSQCYSSSVDQAQQLPVIPFYPSRGRAAVIKKEIQRTRFER